MDEIKFVATWDENGSVGVIQLTKTELEALMTSVDSDNSESFDSALITDAGMASCIRRILRN